MESWQLTYIQFCENWLKNNKYKKAYQTNPEKWENKKRDLLKDWEDILLERAEIGSIPEKVIRSYVNLFSEKRARSMFRGRKEKGLQEWEQTQIKKQHREPVIENLRKLVL